MNINQTVKKIFKAGIDIGSTTVKLVITDADGTMLFGEYRRHLAHTKETLCALLGEAFEKLGDVELCVRITGSGSISIAKSLSLPFVQEVVAVAHTLKALYPQTDVAVELGGEDAKIIYFGGGLEERMNGVCAGGTGSFIDQMASLLQTDAAGLNEAARDAEEIYPIASRCGVFAKTDIQPLINDGAARADIAASVFQAVVNQTVSGLACGKPIEGNVAFLGGPLHFMPELKKASEIGMLYFSKMPEPLPPSSKEYAYRHEPVDLLKAMYSIYSRGGKAPEPDISAAVPKRIIYSVRDKSLQILHRLRDGCASLNEIYRDCRSRSEVVAAFMSILELCSMGSIHITRGENDYSLEFVGGDMDSIIDKIVE